MSQFMKRKTLGGSVLSVTLMAALLVPAAMAGEKTHADHQKGQAVDSQQMDHSKMKDHGSMKHEHNTDKAKASQDHDQ